MSVLVRRCLAILVMIVYKSTATAQTAVDSQGVYSEDRLTVRPVVLRQPEVVYPESLRRAGIGGTVLVRVALDRTGRPDSTSARVVSSSDTALNALALAVVLGSHFTGGLLGSTRVRALLAREVRFDPQVIATAPPPIYEEEDDLTVKPALLGPQSLEYPEHLRRLGLQGRVMVQVVLDTLGRVDRQSIQFVATPDPRFLPPVRRFLTTARFRPGERNGRPVRVLIYVPFDFRINYALPLMRPF